MIALNSQVAVFSSQATQAETIITKDLIKRLLACKTCNTQQSHTAYFAAPEFGSTSYDIDDPVTWTFSVYLA